MLISPIHLRTLVDTLALDGQPYREAMAQAGLTEADLDAQGPWVDESVFDRFMCAAVRVTGDPGYGFTASTSLAQTRYGPHALLIVHAPTLRQAFEDIRQFSVLIVEEPEIDLVSHGSESCLTARPIGTSPEGLRFRMEWLMSLCVQLSRRAGSQESDLYEVTFPYPQPAHVHRYQTVFGNRLRFDAPQGSLRFSSAVLDAPLPGHDRLVYDTLRLQVESLMATRYQRQELVTALRQAVFRALPRVPDAAELAALVGQSERSMRRQLARRDLSVPELVQRCQRELAERLLREGVLPIKQIADQTGFSSASCFHRAFRRWHGVTPSEWRAG
jgi:AraC-like DNA-binding protein